MNLQDSTLEGVSVDWEAGTAVLRVKPSLVHMPTSTGDVIVRATGLHRLTVPHELPWGPSVSINGTTQSATADGRVTFEIEMQSGDTIVVEADDIVFEGSGN